MSDSPPLPAGRIIPSHEELSTIFSNFGSEAGTPSTVDAGLQPAPNMMDPQPLDTVSLSGGGWLGQMYHFGVAQALIDAGVIARHDEPRPTKFVGTSAGALVASALAGELDVMAMRNYALDCADHLRARPWRIFGMDRYVRWSVRKFARELMSRDEIAERLRRTLEVYVTVLPMVRSRALTGFADLDEAEEALRASCCLAPFVGLPFRLRRTGEWVVDGGLAAFQPRFGQPGVLTVSAAPFFPSSIRPSLELPYLWSIIPPPRQQHVAIFDLGYVDTVNHLVRTNRVSGAQADRLMSAAPYMEPDAIRRRLAGHDLGEAPAANDREVKRWEWITLLETTIAVFVFGFMLRPLAVTAMYVEMWFLFTVDLLKATCGLLLPQLFDRGHDGAKTSAFRQAQHQRRRSILKRRLQRAYHRWRNAISLRVFLRLVLGGVKWIPINESRLKEHSAVYRLLYPDTTPRAHRRRSHHHLNGCSENDDGATLYDPSRRSASTASFGASVPSCEFSLRQ
jgi:hypothetical protein